MASWLSHKNLVLYVVTNVTLLIAALIPFNSNRPSFYLVPAFFYLEKDLDIFDILMGSNDCANVQKEGKNPKHLTLTHRKEKRVFEYWMIGQRKTFIYPQYYWFSMYGCWQQIFFNFIVFPENLKIM